MNIQVESFRNGQLNSVVERDFYITCESSSPARPTLTLSNALPAHIPLQSLGGNHYQMDIPLGETIQIDVQAAVSNTDSVELFAVSEHFSVAPGSFGPCSGPGCASFSALPALKAQTTAIGQLSWFADSTIIGKDSAIHTFIFTGVSKDTCSPPQSDLITLDVLTYLPSGLSTKELEKMSWDVYPNPSKGELRIKSTAERTVFRLLDLSGREQAIYTLTDKEATWSLSDLPAGVYILEVDGKYFSKHIIQP